MDDNDLIDVKEVLAIVRVLPRLKFISAVENDFTEEDEVLLENYCRANDIVCEIEERDNSFDFFSILVKNDNNDDKYYIIAYDDNSGGGTSSAQT